VVTILAKRLFVASVVNRVGKSALNRLRNDLLDLLRDNGVLAIVQGVGLGGRLISLAVGGVDLKMLLDFQHQAAWQSLNVQSRGEPPRVQKEPPPGPCWAQQTGRWRGTCPVRTRL
jgi:hypothetical protein